MKLITIGGIPGSGKTTLGRKMGEENQCLSLELEALRWDFFKSDLENNIFVYTNNQKIKEGETLRDYYLQNLIYDGIIEKETFKKLNIKMMTYINQVTNDIYNELKEIEKCKNIDKLKKFISKYKYLINYIPKEITLQMIDTIIISHVLISTCDIAKLADKNIILNVSKNICRERFKEREKIESNKYDKKIDNYLQGCLECINDINKKDIRIKNDGYNFHFRVAAVIIQDNKFLIQQIEGYDYYILPGGHVLLGESSLNALEREVKEEVGCNIDIEHCKFFCFHENFYNKKEKIEHWIENYFTVKTEFPLPNKDWDVEENDNGEKKLLHFKWVTKEELKKIDLKPTSIKKILMNNKSNEFNYLIDGGLE